MGRATTGARLGHRLAFGGFLAWYAGSLACLAAQAELPLRWRWMDGLLFALAALTLVIGAGRRLPWQNVLAAAGLIAVMGGAASALGARSGAPFGPVGYSENLGELLFGTLPWPVPFLWVAGTLSSRGVARLILRPWRKASAYGFWVIGLTCALVVALALNLEPFAVRVKQYWLWPTQPGWRAWYSAPWANFLSWAVVTLGILVFATPWLLLKKPIEEPSDSHPVLVWVLLNLHFLAGNALHGLWTAVAVGGALTVWPRSSPSVARGGKPRTESRRQPEGRPDSGSARVPCAADGVTPSAGTPGTSSKIGPHVGEQFAARRRDTPALVLKQR